MLISALTLRNIMANNKPYVNNYTLSEISEEIFIAASRWGNTELETLVSVRDTTQAEVEEALKLLEEAGYKVEYRLDKTPGYEPCYSFKISWERKLYTYHMVTISPDGQYTEYDEDDFFPRGIYTDHIGNKIIPFWRA